MAFDLNMIQDVYAGMPRKVAAARKLAGRPLTLAEKILYAHLFDELPAKPFVRGETYVNFKPDRVAMQDATAQFSFPLLIEYLEAAGDVVIDEVGQCVRAGVRWRYRIADNMNASETVKDIGALSS